MSNKLDAKALQDLYKLLASAQEQFDTIRRVDHVRSLRGEVTASWLDNFMDRMNQNMVTESHLINAETGKPHTVETLVADLRQRVGLDALAEKQPEVEIPLSKKKATLLDFDKIKTSIDNFLSSHRGHTDDQAVLYYLRDLFGEDKVNELSDKITTYIAESRKQYDSAIVTDADNTAILSQPLKFEDQDLKEDEQLFSNIQNALNGKR